MGGVAVACGGGGGGGGGVGAITAATVEDPIVLACMARMRALVAPHAIRILAWIYFTVLFSISETVDSALA